VPLAHAAPGWTSLDLPGGGRATRFLPTVVSPDAPAPLVIFLHGAGGMPEHYHAHLEGHAEALDVVLLLPESGGQGWSGTDVTTIVQGLDAVEGELTVDERRIYLAGHSAGGAFAYLLAYEGAEGFAAVFSMSAPSYAVSSISDPMHTAPIRMYYGADDPNYTGGAAAMLEAQWTQLGIPYETDVQAGYGHSSWPPSSIEAGLEFLLANPYPGLDPEPEPPDPDPDKEGTGTDTRGGDEASNADTTGGDTASHGSDDDANETGTPHRPEQDDDRQAQGGCACTSGTPWPTGAPSWSLALLVLARFRRSSVG
jgi:predicted esterase